MSLRRLFAAALVAMSAVALMPQESHAQYGGCSTCGTVSTYRPMVVRYGWFGRPRAVYYGAPAVAYAPTAAYYAPRAAYYSPVSSGCSSCATSAFYPSACSSCSTCAPSACSSCAPTGCTSCAPSGCSTCSTSYAPSIVSVPVTTYRPVSSCNSCGGVATYMQPVTSYVQQVQYTPQTSCSSSCAPSSCSYTPSCGPSCTGCSQCSESSTSCGPGCTGCSQCSGQNHNHSNDQYPQTQPGAGYDPANSQPQVPQTFRNERPQTYPDTQPTPNTYSNEQQQNLRPIPNTSGASVPNNGGSNGQPQLIDPDSHTTQAPQRSWNFHQAVASQDDLTSRIIPVEHQKPAPRVQNDVPANDGWRAARSR